MIASDTSVRVAYFAAARELCGTGADAVTIEAPIDVRAFLEKLGERHPRLAPLVHRMRLAINGELAADTALVRPGDEVAVLPPVAGGSGADVREAVASGISSAPLSIDAAVAHVSHAAAGGIAIFVGTVRDHADGQSVARLDYEAHPALAEQELRRVLDELHTEQPETRLYAFHRTGELRVGDLAVVVAASAPHRAEAFRACREAIERIKQRVPVWKKEWAPDGSAHWVNL